ncbi:MAG TPA: aminoglycoside 3-N-acetyltransferase [Ktedonobacterales bacterium]|nr:aminoglycoside 3-N-acetyltransferase [Ktedonobacterales bacterium]
MSATDAPAIAPSRLRADLAALGLRAGDTVMLHGSMRAIGPVMGGPTTVVASLLELLGLAGTLMMYSGWQDLPDWLGQLEPDAQAAYEREYPPFDPATARAVRDHGILAEVVRTWPGAQRSLNPEASMVAIGAAARDLTRDHPRDYGYGAGSPLARLVERGGRVLLLGAPLDTITLLHYAEATAHLRHKATVRYRYPTLDNGRRVWIAVEDFNTGEPHAAYSFEQIARDYLAAGRGHAGAVGNAPSHLFDAADLAAFAVAWLEERFS